jgi:predicted RNA-binding protein YlqC (UPF0109 family)
MMEKDEELALYIAQCIVDRPDAVSVERTIDERGVLLTLHVDKSDMGKIIGKNGATAGAIRTIIHCLKRGDTHVSLKIHEPEDSVIRQHHR